jgi:hypothetical protein
MSGLVVPDLRLFLDLDDGELGGDIGGLSLPVTM